MTNIEISEIELPNYNISKVSRELFTLMLNKPLCDYASLEEMFSFEEMELYEPDEISVAVDELRDDRNNFIFEIQKPYGTVYAVNKKKIPEMYFVYQPADFNELTGN